MVLLELAGSTGRGDKELLYYYFMTLSVAIGRAKLLDVPSAAFKDTACLFCELFSLILLAYCNGYFLRG